MCHTVSSEGLTTSYRNRDSKVNCANIVYIQWSCFKFLSNKTKMHLIYAHLAKMVEQQLTYSDINMWVKWWTLKEVFQSQCKPVVYINSCTHVCKFVSAEEDQRICQQWLNSVASPSKIWSLLQSFSMTVILSAFILFSNCSGKRW